MRGAAAVVVVLALAAGLAPGAEVEASSDPCAQTAPAPFADRDQISSVHRAAVDCLWELGILRGQRGDDGRRRFEPRTSVSRAQLVGMVHRTLTLTGDAGALPEPRRPRFADLPAGHTFDDEVHELAAVGVVAGLDATTFGPGRSVSRDQTASLLVRAVGWATDRDLEATAGPYFSDVDRTVHREAIHAAFEYGMLTGTRRPCGQSGGAFSPDRSTERQQIATVLVRVLMVMDEIRAGEGGHERADPECPTPHWEPRIAPARDYAQTRAGTVSFAAVGTDGQLVGHRADTRVAAASTLKVMFLVAYLDHPDVRDRPLRQADRDLLEPMIRWSADEPATEIADLLGPEPMNRLAQRAGMRDFSYTRPWGLSTTSARDQARFLRDLPHHLPARHRDDALQLLTEIVRDQRWGVGEVATPGWTTHFKGGWGSGTGAVAHQVVLLRHDEATEVAVAVMTTDNPDHGDGATTLREVFARLLDDLP